MERFPSELLFQGLSTSTANPTINADRLTFYDTFSGNTRLSHIDRVAKVSGLLDNRVPMGTLQQAFDRLGLTVATERLKMKADVLNPPELIFQGHQHETRISDGSWDVQHRRFLIGSRLHSFAVIRLARPNTISNRDTGSFFDQLQDTFKHKGVRLSFSSMSHHLTENIVDVHPVDSSSSDVVSTTEPNQLVCALLVALT